MISFKIDVYTSVLSALVKYKFWASKINLCTHQRDPPNINFAENFVILTTFYQVDFLMIVCF